MKYKLSSLIVVFLFILLVALAPVPAQSDAFECAIRILEPRPGQEVASRIKVEGTASIPDGYHLWVFARRSDFQPLWWSQGEGTVDAKTGKWSAFATLGVPEDVSYDFDLTVAIVVREQYLQLRDNLLKAMKSGEFRPTEIPAAACVAGAVKVKKTKQ
jgi:hypothetical protein